MLSRVVRGPAKYQREAPAQRQSAYTRRVGMFFVLFSFFLPLAFKDISVRSFANCLDNRTETSMMTRNTIFAKIVWKNH